MSRLRILENGEVVGDSGWGSNQIVDRGTLDYLAALLGNTTNSKQVSRMMLGTGTSPGATDVTLHGELNTATYTRTTVSVSLMGSTAVEFQATWASANSHITASTALQNVGIIHNTTSGGTIMAGRTYTVSTWNTNQDVTASYRITFATA